MNDEWILTLALSQTHSARKYDLIVGEIDNIWIECYIFCSDFSAVYFWLNNKLYFERSKSTKAWFDVFLQIRKHSFNQDFWERE